MTTSPATLGVRPDARLATAFLSQAFLWMFAGLLITAGVAAVVQSQPAPALEFAKGSFFFLFIIQIGIVIGITAAINRISALAALGLFFVYAASLGVTIGLHRRELHDRFGRDRVPQRVGDVRCGGRLRPRDPALAGGDGRAPVHGPHRAVRRDGPEHLPCQQHA